MAEEQFMRTIYIFNCILLVGLVGGLVWWQKKHGRITANKFAALITGYFSFASVTTLSPFLLTDSKATVIVDIVLLMLLWCVLYPWARWIYNQFDSSK